jgi:two-component system sensor histidine kinase KdpD
LSEEQRDRVADTLRLAERLGGEGITMPSSARRIADDVLNFAHANKVTQIVLGKSSRTRWFEILHGSVVHDLVRRSGNISVHVIAGDQLTGEPLPKKTIRTADNAPVFDPLPYLAAISAVAVALGLGELIQHLFGGIETVDLVFLTAIVVIAVRYGLLPSFAASVVASLCYNFFFLPPIYTFTMSDPANVAAFLLFAIVAVIVSHVGAGGPRQTVTAQGRVRALESLYAFSRKLAGAGTLDDVLWATAYQTALMLNVRVVLLLLQNDAIAVKAGYPPEDMLDDADLAAAKWAWENNRSAGRGSDTLPGAKRLFLPMRTGRGSIGIVGIDKPGPILTPLPAPAARRADRPGCARH